MNKPPIRTVVIVLAVAFAIATPIWRELVDFGISQAQFAAPGNETLRAAGWAFSIWGVIYAGVAVYGVWQALPRTPESPLLRAVGWPSAFGIGACADWIIASALDWRWLSVVIILIAAGSTLFALWRAVPEAGTVSATERRIVLWPLGLLGGWLTAAAALNILMVATAEGLIGPANATAFAGVGLAVVTAVALAMLARTRSLFYAAAVVWAFVGIWAAERADSGFIAWLALACAAITALGWAAFSRRT